MLPDKDAPKVRMLSFERAGIDIANRTVPISVSSDTDKILRYVTGKGVGYEVLAHESLASIDLSRFSGPNGGPILWSHDDEQIIGRFAPVSVSGGKLRGVARFAEAGVSPKSDEIFGLIRDSIVTDTSCRYEYDEADVIQTGVAPDGYPIYTAKRWKLTEASFVSVPADELTGVGRSEVTITVNINDESVDASTDNSTESGCVETEITNVGSESGSDAADCTDPNCTEDSPCADCVAGGRKCAPTRALTTGLPRPTMEAPMETNTGSVDQTQITLEVLQLRSIAANLGKGKEAEEILAAKPLPEARALINTLLATASAPVAPSMDMSKKEAQEYSYARAIQNALGRMEGEKVARSFEDEVADTIEKGLPANYARKGGVLVPLQLRTTLTSGGSGTGAEGVYTTYGGELIELLRNYAATIKMGARVLNGLQGPVSFPKQTADASAVWVAENPGSDVTDTNPTFGTVTLSPKLLQGATAFSRSLMAQSVFSVESVVRQSLAAAHALAYDKALLHGTGASNQPTGVYKISGVNTVAFGGVPTYALLQDMITEVAKDNALMGTLGFITNPGIAGVLSKTLESSVAGAKYIWGGDRQDGTVCGYKAASTNQVSAVMSTLDATGGAQQGIIYGNWSDCLIGTWGGGLELILDPYTLKKQALIEVASYQMADVAVRHAQSFCVSTGATLS